MTPSGTVCNTVHELRILIGTRIVASYNADSFIPIYMEKSLNRRSDYVDACCFDYIKWFEILWRYSTCSFARCIPKEYEGVSISFQTSRLEWELQMVQHSDTRCSHITIVWVSLVSFAAITLCIASERVIPNVSIYFVMDSVRKLLNTPSYITQNQICYHTTTQPPIQ